MLRDVKNVYRSKRLMEGIYQSFWFNFELEFRGTQVWERDYPSIEGFEPIGVCDTPEQLFELLPMSVKAGEKNYAISMVQIRRAEQPPQGGWRWHKWGAYIGCQKPEHEYLFHDTHIDAVWTFHIYELADQDFVERPRVPRQDLENAHLHSGHHRDEVMLSEKCGCFYCLKIFKPSEIKEWTEGQKTALCPHCGIDSVIGSSSLFPITEDFLKEMHLLWFSVSKKKRIESDSPAATILAREIIAKSDT